MSARFKWFLWIVALLVLAVPFGVAVLDYTERTGLIEGDLAVFLDAISEEQSPPPAPSEVPIPDCEITLTLVSIEVLEDTEIGEEEWLIRTYALYNDTYDEDTGFNPGFIAISADEGDGVVLINELADTQTISKDSFPVSAIVQVLIFEEDPLYDEMGIVTIEGFRLSCPESREVSFDVWGEGQDIIVVFVDQDFRVNLKYRWEVVER